MSLAQSFKSSLLIIVLLAGLSIFRSVLAVTETEYATFGKKAAAYFGAVMMLQELQISRCKGYLKADEVVKVDSAQVKQEILKSFPVRYKDDLNQLFFEIESARPEYRGKFNDPKINLSEQCPRIIGFTLGTVSSAITEWQEAKKKYGLRTK